MMLRRQFVSIPLMTIGIGCTTGCLPLLGLVRLGMRGGAIRGGARAARVSPRGTLHTLGRTGAVALHAVRLLRVAQAVERVGRIGEIFGVENGEEAVCVDATEHGVECSVQGAVICSTHADGRFFEHTSVLFGPCGTSRVSDEKEIKHWDSKGAPAGTDVLETDGIRHLGNNNQLIGYSRLKVAQRGSGGTVAILERDGFLNAQLADLRKTHREVLGADGAHNLQAIAAAQAQCLARASHQACQDLVSKADDALRQLETRFQRFAASPVKTMHSV